MTEVLQHEGVEGLARHRDADDEAEDDRGAKRGGDARVLEVPPDGRPKEFLLRERAQSGLALDLTRGGFMRPAGLGLGEDNAEHLALLGRELQRLVVGRVDVGVAEEMPVRLAQRDHARLAVIDLEGVAEAQRLGATDAETLHGEVIDDDAVGQAEIFELAREHDGRASDERRPVQADEHDGLEVAVVQLGLLHGDEERHGPFHAGHGTHAAHVGVAHGLHLIDLLDLRVHDPNGGVHVAQMTGGPEQEAEEDRALLRHQQRRKGQPADEHEILGAVADEHFEREMIHGVMRKT